MHVLAGQEGLPPGFAAMELTVPPHFAGPIPHAHDEFDEAIYVLSGRLLVAPRGHRHGFSNPSAEGALVLGIWAPPEPALAFMREIGAALSPDVPPDPERMRDIYARHASRLLP
jgi:mannose-6-phosphate isomerase-like protein (cupin superfamily)